MAQRRNQDFLSNEERLTDIDVAMLLIGLMGDPPDIAETQADRANDKGNSVNMVKGILGTFTNPLAKELVMERIAG